MDKKIIQLLSRILTGRANQEEIDVANSWYKNKVEDKIVVNDNLEVIQRRVINGAYTKLGIRHQLLRSLYWAVSTAASIVLIIGISILLINNSSDELVISCQTSTPIEYTLPDSSRIIIYKGGSVTYPKRFRNNTRDVRMTGKVYFDIQKNPAKQFLVYTSISQIKVLGTSFMVDSYDGKDSHIEVIRGTVSVSVNGINTQYTLNKNDYLTINSQSLQASVKHKAQTILFEGQTLTRICEVLSDEFDIECRIGSKSISDKEYIGEFDRNEGVANIVNVIAIALDLNVNISGDLIIFTSK